MFLIKAKHFHFFEKISIKNLSEGVKHFDKLK